MALRFIGIPDDGPCLHSSKFGLHIPAHPVGEHPDRERWRSGVYAARDEHGACLYVGRSVTVWVRLRKHVGQAWWASVRSVDVTLTPCEIQTQGEERRQILALKPLHNQRIPGGRRPLHRGEPHGIELSWGEAIRQRRAQVGMSQHELAHAAGYTQLKVSQIERGDLGHAEETCRRVAAAFGVPVRDLFPLAVAS